MGNMFYGAKSFNQPIGIWQTSKVTAMGSLFYQAKLFNQALGAWDVSQVTNMEGMFAEASAFNQDITKWDASKVETMNGMFNQASAFNSDISSWQVSKLRQVNSMFDGASSFNKILCSQTWMERKSIAVPSQMGPGMSASKSRIFCCNAGSYASNKDPSTFTGGFTYDNNNGESTDARVWTELTKADDCPKCPAGQYTDSVNIAATCQQCPRNTVAPTEGLLNCAICTNGAFSNDGLSCTTCGAGTFTSVGTDITLCDNCTKGKYQDIGIRDKCFGCPLGWYQKDEQKPYCLPCIRKTNLILFDVLLSC